MHYCRRDSHATSPTAIYANITQTGRIWVYCSWFWVVLVGFVGFVGGFGWFWVVLLVVLGGFESFWVVLGRFGWFWVVPCFSNYPIQCELSFFFFIFYNICFSQLSYFVSDRPDERLHGSISASRSIFTTNFET